MILRALEVEGFRCFDRRLRVEGFTPGINILSGPNGTGKSTLLRALRHVLLDSYGVSGVAVRDQMTPWGRALAPRIVAEFAHGEEEWRIEKRFLTGAAAALERLENGVYRPVAAGREAETRVRTMLQAEAPARGMAQDEHLGLLQVLWTPQGPPGLAPWNDGVRTTLQEAFGAALRSAGDERLGEAVARRFGEYFSPTGQERKASPVMPLRAEAASLEQQADRLRTEWERVSRLRQEVAALVARIEARTPELVALEAAVASARRQQTEVMQARNVELEATRAFQGLQSRVDGWRADIATRQRLTDELLALGAAHAEAERKLTEARALLPQVEECERQMELLTQSGQEAAKWPEVLRLRDLDRRRSELREESAGLAAPAAKQVEAMQRIHRTLEVKRAALDASSLKLTLTAEKDLTVQEGEASHAIGAGETLELRRPQTISIDLPGVARIVAASANEQAGNLQRETAELERQLADLLQGLTLAEAVERQGRKAALEQQLRMLDAEATALDARRAEFEALAARRPEWESAQPDVQAIREEWKQCRERRDAIRAQADVAARTGEETGLRTKLQDRQRSLEEAAGRLAQHAAAGTLEELEARRDSAALALTAATARRKELEKDGAADLAALERQANTAAAALLADREQRASREGELNALQSTNLYSRLAQTEERLAACRTELERETRRATAVRLLAASLQEARAEMTASLPERIAESATRYWRAIAGEAAPAIRINSAWTPGGLDVPGAAAALEELSGGEAEQVAFATRLALAGQLTQAGRQLAVFDDSFLATDPARAGRILHLLAEASQHLQILILTCHPGRYAAFDGARHFDLEKLKQ